MAKQIPLVGIPFNSFLTGRISETIFIYPILILLNFITSVSPLSQANQLDLHDDITVDIIKKSQLKNLLAQPLTEIINGSLLNGIYPDLLKLAKVIPMFKTDNSANFSNYRPISLLSNFQNF